MEIPEGKEMRQSRAGQARTAAGGQEADRRKEEDMTIIETLREDWRSLDGKERFCTALSVVLVLPMAAAGLVVKFKAG
jgi:hypothetical protein